MEKTPPAVLLVDDDPDDVLVLKVVLEPLGLALIQADSGEEALSCLLERDFAAILMDVRMPGMNGLETAALIRQRERSRATPLIFMSGFDRDDLRLLPGYADYQAVYLPKPVDPEALRAAVARAARS
jgi:CheY-like chemotaxis protein